ncbi:MAG: DNA-protecting protein DprA [Flavobacterium sp.]|nr:DNA-protecting protein DprA [Flavobacterium sp.]
MLQNELYYTLALLQVEGVGDILAKKLIHHCGSAEEVFKSKKSTLASIEGIGKSILKNIQDKTVFYKTENELQIIENENINIWYYQENNYPERLKQCFDAPVVLFQSGNIDLSNRKIISIVGTRQITTYGTEFTKKFIEDLAPLNPIIVSGFAYGVDIVAHQVAMDFGLQTIGVLAHGLNQIYPKVHKKYIAKMEENGGFLTEFWSDSKPDRENFVKRNRIVAGMSEATIVVESAEKGGSLITAQIANDYNRDVFAVPGRTTDKYSQGCNNLIKTQRANMLTSAADLVYILNWEIKKKEEKNIQKQLFVSLTDEEQKIYDYLTEKNNESIDIIALDCGLPIYKISSILLNMELKGIIRPLPGKIFELI